MAGVRVLNNFYWATELLSKLYGFKSSLPCPFACVATGPGLLTYSTRLSFGHSSLVSCLDRAFRMSPHRIASVILTIINGSDWYKYFRSSARIRPVLVDEDAASKGFLRGIDKLLLTLFALKHTRWKINNGRKIAIPSPQDLVGV